MLQASFKNAAVTADAGPTCVNGSPCICLADLPFGQQGVLARLDLPEATARRLMELGFLPGCPVMAAHSAPGGDPRVFRVDGSEIALRRETAQHLYLEPCR